MFNRHGRHAGRQGRKLGSAGLAAALVATGLVAASPAGDVARAAEAVPGGPVILDGNDPADHVTNITQYMNDVYDVLDSNVAAGYSNNGKVAVIGTCSSMLGTSMSISQTFVPFDTAAEVEGLFSNIGANNYKHVHICSDDDSTLPLDVEDELDRWGTAIAEHVNRGGGLFSTGHSYNWLNDLFPSLTVFGGGTSSSYVTADGNVFFPNLKENDLVNAVNHYTFGDVNTTTLKPLLSELTNGGGKIVAIGGTTIRFPQISLNGPTAEEVGTLATYTLEAADADGTPLSSNTFDYQITGVTDAVASGTETTDANGEFSWTFTGNAKGTTKIEVQMSLGTGESAGSSITTTWAIVPAAPTITSAVDEPGGDDTVRVSWNDGDDGGRAITDYVIEYSDNGTDWTTVADGVSTDRYTLVSGLATEADYQFRVAALNDIGQGAWSAPVTGSAIGSPTEPLNLALAHTSGTLTASWDPPASDNGGAITHYVVRHAPSGSGSWTTIDPASAPLDITGLTDGQEYDVQVAAVNSDGQGAWSTVAAGTPSATPGVVQNLVVHENDGELVVEWAESVNDGGSMITGYEVTTDFGQDCTPEHWHPEGKTGHYWRCTYTGLTNGATHTITVAAQNENGVGVADSIEGVPFGAPKAPAVSTTDGDGTSTVMWDAAPANGRDVTGYTVKVDGAVHSTLGADARDLELTGLTSGQSYSVKVFATNAAGDGALGSATAKPFAVPSAPTVTLAPGDGGIEVAWTAANGNGRPVSAYRVSVDGVERTTTSGTARSAVVSGLDNDQTYEISVIAVNAAGQSPAGTATGSPKASPALLDLELKLQTGRPAGGARVDVNGEGLKPNSTVRIEMHSDPVLLGTTTTDDEGSFTTSVYLPSTVAPGSHDVIAIGEAPDGSPVTASEPVYVDWSGTSASTDAEASDGYTSVDPVRVSDTRGGAKVAAGATHRVEVAPSWGVPADATAVTLNVTVTEPDEAGYVTVHPCGVRRPDASTQNFVAGQDIANMVVVPVGIDQEICINSTARTHVVVDLGGYHHPGSDARLTPVGPVRVHDSRPDGRLAAGQVVEIPVDGAGVPAEVTDAVVLNVAAAEPDAAGYLTVFPCGGEVPFASNVNFGAGQTVANHVTVKVGESESVCVYSSAPTHLVVDLAASFTAASGAT
ncbi:MAG: fibronectin type III domain-containing protein, partial [Ilumatobacteraceae bacterium]